MPDLSPRRRLLYLPVEVKPRELHGKLLLAARAAERNWQVRVGRDREIRAALANGPPGAFIDVNIPEQKAGEIASYAARGHWIGSMCEESVVYYGAHDYCHRKIGPTTLASVRTLFVVGGRNADDLRDCRPETAPKIVLTGNPRFDILTPQLRGVFAPDADNIRRRYGKFLLVNTNFGPVNHAKRKSEEILSEQKRRGLVASADHEAFLRRWHAYKRSQMTSLQSLLAEVARTKRFEAIVLRPHPTEDHAAWQAWAAPLGIGVAFEGSANTWMLAAEYILHTGCTTAVEAAFLDRPVASFVPEPRHEMLNQADAISEQIRTAAELLAIVDRPAAPLIADQRSRAAHLVANAHPPAAVDRILDALDTADLAEEPLLGDGGRSWMTTTLRQIRTAVRRNNAYAHRKFDGLVDDDIRGPLAHWVTVGGLTRMPDFRTLPDGTWHVW